MSIGRKLASVLEVVSLFVSAGLGLKAWVDALQGTAQETRDA
jgi:hypothetical protein